MFALMELRFSCNIFSSFLIYSDNSFSISSLVLRELDLDKLKGSTYVGWVIIFYLGGLQGITGLVDLAVTQGYYTVENYFNYSDIVVSLKFNTNFFFSSSVKL